MQRISPAKAATAAGMVMAGWQAIWLVMLGAGWAKPLLEFLLELRFVVVPYMIAHFSAGVALCGVAIAFCTGALSGFMFALAWNWVSAEDVTSTGVSVRLRPVPSGELSKADR